LLIFRIRYLINYSLNNYVATLWTQKGMNITFTSTFCLICWWIYLCAWGV